MPTLPATRRLSPKVRRLLQHHDVDARVVPGTGAEGRITWHDVVAAAGHGAGHRHEVLASPLARKVLRDAGIELAAAARANDGRRLTRDAAERVIRTLGGTDVTSHRAPGSDVGTHTTTGEVEVEVGRLLARIAAAREDFLAHNGFDLAVEVAVASAAAAVLVRRPDLAILDPLQPAQEHGGPAISLGFPRPEGGSVAVVPDAHHLTVAGLARRARAALEQQEPRDTAAVAAPPAVVVAADATAPGRLSGSAAIGLLTVSTHSLRDVTSVDELGHTVVRTRPHATLRLHHDDRISPQAAAAFLGELGTAVTSWSLPVGP